jgi:antitoxin HigA-1
MIPLPEAPRHPGTILKNLLGAQKVHPTQEELAEALGVSRRRLNELMREKRGITPDTALRLAHYFDTSPEYWLHAQVAWDLHQARRSRQTVREIARIPRGGVAMPADRDTGADVAAARSSASTRGVLPDPPDLHRLRLTQLESLARDYEFLMEFLERRGLAARALRHARIRAQMDSLNAL